jgi:hypothetical protein
LIRLAAPSARLASLKEIAIACFGLVTFCPDEDLSDPFLNSLITMAILAFFIIANLLEMILRPYRPLAGCLADQLQVVVTDPLEGYL